MHASTAIFLGIPLVGFLAARALLARADVRSTPRRARGSVPPGSRGARMAAADHWRDCVAFDPKARRAQARARQVRRRATCRLAPSLRAPARGRLARRRRRGRRARPSCPLAAFAARQRWAAFVLGGTSRCSGSSCWSGCSRISPTPCPSPRRGGRPGSSRSRSRSRAARPSSRAWRASSSSRWRWPPGSRCSTRSPVTSAPASDGGGPAAATWIAAVGGLAAIVVGLLLRRRLDRAGWLAGAAVLLFCVPVVVHGFAQLEPPGEGRPLRPHARPPPRAAHSGSQAGDRLLRPGDELPHLRVRARVRGGRAARRTWPTRRPTGPTRGACR